MLISMLGRTKPGAVYGLVQQNVAGTSLRSIISKA
jgi:hypothetical protein